VLAELARRVGLSPHDLPRDEDLLAAEIAYSSSSMGASPLNDSCPSWRRLAGGSRHGARVRSSGVVSVPAAGTECPLLGSLSSPSQVRDAAVAAATVRRQ
jgi:hypothetical protein